MTTYLTFSTIKKESDKEICSPFILFSSKEKYT